MTGLAKSLERDAQMESLLRPRARELGLIRPFERELSRELTHWYEDGNEGGNGERTGGQARP